MASAFRREYVASEEQDATSAAKTVQPAAAPTARPREAARIAGIVPDRVPRSDRALGEQRTAVPLRAASLCLAAVLLPIAAPAADPPGTPLSREAIGLCHQAQSTSPSPSESERSELLERSLARADEAIAADERDALAHFARFCALGEQARRAGVSVTSLLKLGPLRSSVERTLELAPDFPDALLGKGALLLSLPTLLGGDDAEGERLVRRALEIDPEFIGARLTLAEALADRGDVAGSRREGERALAFAERRGEAEQVDDARRFLTALPATTAAPAVAPETP